MADANTAQVERKDYAKSRPIGGAESVEELMSILSPKRQREWRNIIDLLVEITGDDEETRDRRRFRYYKKNVFVVNCKFKKFPVVAEPIREPSSDSVDSGAFRPSHSLLTYAFVRVVRRG